MKEIVDDYKRRLETITETIETTSDTGSKNDIAKMARLKAKQAEYRTIIAELERSYRQYVTNKMDPLIAAYNEATYGGATGGVIRAMITLFQQVAHDLGYDVQIEWEGHTKYTITERKD